MVTVTYGVFKSMHNEDRVDKPHEIIMVETAEKSVVWVFRSYNDRYKLAERVKTNLKEKSLITIEVMRSWIDGVTIEIPEDEYDERNIEKLYERFFA